MIQLKCPKCRSDLEIEDYKVEEKGTQVGGEDIRIGVFCKDEKCSFHDSPLIGIERKSSKVFLSQSIV